MAKPFVTTKRSPPSTNTYFPAAILGIHAGKCEEGVTSSFIVNSEVQILPSLTYPAQASAQPGELYSAFMVYSVD